MSRRLAASISFCERTHFCVCWLYKQKRLHCPNCFSSFLRDLMRPGISGTLRII